MLQLVPLIIVGIKHSSGLIEMYTIINWITSLGVTVGCIQGPKQIIKPMINNALLIAICSFLILSTSCISANQRMESDSAAESNSGVGEELYNALPSSVIDSLNREASLKNVSTEEGIMNLFRPEAEVLEGNYSYTISSEVIDSTTVKLLLVEEGILDDSLAGRRTIMVLRRGAGTPLVLSIKESYRCYKGRGSESWSAALCL